MRSVQKKDDSKNWIGDAEVQRKMRIWGYRDAVKGRQNAARTSITIFLGSTGKKIDEVWHSKIVVSVNRYRDIVAPNGKARDEVVDVGKLRGSGQARDPPVIATCRNSGSGTSDGSITGGGGGEGGKVKGKIWNRRTRIRHPPRYNPRKTSHRSHFLRITPFAQFCAIRTAAIPITL